MLVLTRQSGELIRIGDNVIVTVLNVSDTQIRVGISAPGDVKIDRSEVRDRKCSIPRN